jgi:uncharacterized protein
VSGIDKMKKTLMAGVLVLSALTTAHARTQGPSFDCHRATWPDEAAICSNENLAAKDREVAILYAWAMSHYNEGITDHVHRSQLDWLEERHNCRHDVGCINALYNDRIAQFRNPPPIEREEPEGDEVDELL